MTKRKSWSEEKRRALIKDYEKDMSYEEMAKKYGVSIAAIRSILYVFRKKDLIGKRR